MSRKLDSGDIHLLKLIRKESSQGWAKVSAPVMALVSELPMELVTVSRSKEGGEGVARLTEKGENLLEAMEWLP